MTELKPRPFCGSDDVICGAGLDDEYYVECWGLQRQG